jgi:hypothetical protein
MSLSYINPERGARADYRQTVTLRQAKNGSGIRKEIGVGLVRENWK